MSQPSDIAPEQRELEVLRRLADHMRQAYRDAAGVFSLRTHRVEQWSETELPSMLRTLDAVQGARAQYGRNWEVCPEDEAGVFVLDGRRVKIVPVEPTERMVNDDNASDPPMLHPIGFLDADTLRYVYKQLLRVAPVFPAGKALHAALASGEENAAHDSPVVADQVERGARVAALRQAITEAEHKPGSWAKAATVFGALAEAGQDLSQVLTGGGKEETFASFSHKRDGWLAASAVNALPQLLSIVEQARALVDANENALALDDWPERDRELRQKLREALKDLDAA